MNDHPITAVIRMNQIASNLGKLYKDRNREGLLLWKHEQDRDSRQLHITPVEGWPGKNAEQREIEQRRAFVADEILGKINEQILLSKQLLADIDAEIQALEAERRALEWSIRAGQIEALNANFIQIEPGHDDDRLLDDAAQHQVDTVMMPPDDLQGRMPEPIYPLRTEQLVRPNGHNGKGSYTQPETDDQIPF